MGGHHVALGVLVKLYAQFVQPLYGAGAVVDQLLYQLGYIGVVTAAHYVQIVLGGRIAGLVGGLYAALGHHGVGVAYAQLGHYHHVRAGVVGLYGRRGTGSAAAYHQHVHVVVHLVQVDLQLGEPALALQEPEQLAGALFAGVGAHLDGLKAVLAIVGMVRLEQRVLLVRVHAAGFERDVGFARSLYLRHGGQHFGSEVHICRLLISLSRDGCRAP